MERFIQGNIFSLISVKSQSSFKETSKDIRVTHYAHYDFSEPKVTPLTVLFCPTNSTQPNGIQFTVIIIREKQQILTFERPEAMNVAFILDKSQKQL